MRATRLLMKAALEDPYNQRFQLVCESTIPVRTPIFTHDQLLAQNMSRIGYPGKVHILPMHALLASGAPLSYRLWMLTRLLMLHTSRIIE